MKKAILGLALVIGSLSVFACSSEGSSADEDVTSASALTAPDGGGPAAKPLPIPIELQMKCLEAAAKDGVACLAVRIQISRAQVDDAIGAAGAVDVTGKGPSAGGGANGGQVSGPGAQVKVKGSYNSSNENGVQSIDISVLVTAPKGEKLDPKTTQQAMTWDWIALINNQPKPVKAVAVPALPSTDGSPPAGGTPPAEGTPPDTTPPPATPPAAPPRASPPTPPTTPTPPAAPGGPTVPGGK